jgi:quercetin dioxygenase-like cupin family protein
LLVRKWRELEEYDPGSILGKPELGIKIKRLSNREGGNTYRHSFEMEYYLIEPGKSCPVHKSQCGMINFMLSGTASFITENMKVEARKGDLVYTEYGELQYISNNSNERVEIVCCIDGQKSN